MSGQSAQTEAAALRREHASLDHEIADWRQWWSELSQIGEPHFGEMGDRLTQFREHLAAHFTHEENQGFLSIVMDLPAEVVEQIAHLRDEHGALLVELDRVIACLQTREPGYDCWGNARSEFETFLDRLNAHETAEDALLDKSP